MRLSYRGHSYNPDVTSVDMVNSNMTGSYRGRTYPLTYPRHIPVAQPAHHLIYRGAAYQTTATGGYEPIHAPKSVVEKVTIPAVRPVRPVQNDSYDSIHRLNIQRRLQQRIEAAKARGDQKLLRLLEREMQQAG